MTNGDEHAYRQSDLPVERRVEDLLDRMTIQEKAGQLVGTWGGHMDGFISFEEVRSAVVEDNLGAVATFGWAGSIDTYPEEIAETVNELQERALEDTRLGIPLLFNVDAVHGHAYVAGATVFPNGLGTAATWDPERAQAAADVCATEVTATGAHQNYSPTCDLAREVRWGRAFETFGESPKLVAELAAAKVRGYQGDGYEKEDNVIATAKHFPAYSEPERGEDAAPAEISEYKLRNKYFRSFEAAIDEGVESVMPSYNSTNGEPVHGSRRFLTDILKGELGFDGHVVSDWGGVRHLHEEHRVADDWRESVHRTRDAGLDIASVGTGEHVELLTDLVESGDLPESLLDERVRRILTLKFELGLFEDPFVDAETTKETVGKPEHREVSLDAARTSMTLLKNEDDLLPLSGDEDVFVAGPNADNPVHQLGGWSVHEEDQVEGDTILEAIEDQAEGAVTYEQGTTLNEELDVEAAAEQAADADVAVVAVGEGWYIHEFGPEENAGIETGEWPHRSDLRLHDAQRELVQAIHETGTPVVGVLVTGRPLIVDWMAEHVPSILMAYYPGTEGGVAVAETLFGENDPSGRLPVTVPSDEGDLPQLHDHSHQPRPIGDSEHPDTYDPLFEFGHGLSYTDFEYSDLDVDADAGPGSTVALEVTVENTGDRDGSEVVQVYGSQESPTLVRPEHELVAFERVDLPAGEAATVEIDIPAEDLGYYRPDEGHVVEADSYTLVVEDLETTVSIDGTYL